MKRKRVVSKGLLLFLVTFFLWAVIREAPRVYGSSSTPFFQGKMIRIIVGYAPGGGFDTFARLLARHLSDHVPGQPNVIVQNMPGAGSLVAANRVYQTQPGDGLTIVNFHFSMLLQALLRDPNVRFDPLKFIWLGNPSLGVLPEVLWVRGDLPIHSLEDLKKRKEPLTLGATTRATSASAAGSFLRSVGLPIQNVYGYRGSAPALAALERKEVDGRILPQDNMQTVFRRYIDSGLVRPILAIGKEPRLKPLQNVATLDDLELNRDQRQLAEFLITTWKLLRVYALPPGTPQDRVRELRSAFLDTLESPKLRADAKKQGVIIAPTSGEEVERIVRRLTQTPPPLLDRYKKLIVLQ